jgi:hypothetical protein
MLRTIHAAEKNTVQQAPRVINLVAGTATLVFEDIRNIKFQEIAFRYFQNTGANRLYYTIGVAGPGSTPEAPVPSCDNINNFHGFLEAGQVLDCGSCLQMVSVNSPSGSQVSTTLIYRN